MRRQPVGPATGHKRVGFTLVEIIITIAIIVLIASLLLVALARAQKSASAIRLKADLQAIGSALDAYYSDFGDYPRPTRTNAARAAGASASDQGPTDINDSGAILLTWALLAPGPAETDGFGLVDSAGVVVKDAAGEGKPDFGFLDKPTSIGGKVRLPYLKPENWRVRQRFKGIAIPGGGANTPYCYELRDKNGHAILYYPKIRGTPVQPAALPMPSKAGTPVDYKNAGGIITPTRWVAPFDGGIYNLMDNPSYFSAKGAALTIPAVPPDPNDTVLRAVQAGNFFGPYLLWSAGEDGIFGLPSGQTDPRKSDDVSNIP